MPLRSLVQLHHFSGNLQDSADAQGTLKKALNSLVDLEVLRKQKVRLR